MSADLSISPWPEELDAIKAAPDHHRLVLENEFVRVLDTRIEPGDKTPVHTHSFPAVHCILSWSDFVRRDAAGNVLVDTRQHQLSADRVALWGEPLGPHSLENVGDAAIHIISTEIKPRG